MNKPILLLLLGALFPLLLQAGDAQSPMPSRIEVFTNHRYPISIPAQASTPTQVYDLNAPARLDEELSAGLPADPELAKSIALKRLESLGRAKITEMVNTAYEGITKAITYELLKIPAIVFDNGTSVIYGVSDLDEAIWRYQAWHQEATR